MRIKHYIFYSISLILFSELTLRILGFGAYQPSTKKWAEIDMKVDTLLGFSHIPGVRTYNINNNIIKETNFENRRRLSSNTKQPIKESKRINLYGCSFVHGYGITDTLTYPFILQNLRKKEDIRNFGISGHGLLQFFLLLREHSNNNLKPDIAIVHYGSFHNNRSIWSKTKQINLERYSSNKAKLDSIYFPYARFIDNNKLGIYYLKHKKYTETPLIKYSALINQINNLIIYIKDYSIKKHEVLVNKILMELIIEHCRENDIKLIVAGLDTDKLTQEMLQFCITKNVHALNISQNLESNNYKLSKTDKHPNSKACKIFAERINLELEKILNE